MIQEIDAAIRSLLSDEAFGEDEVDVSFEPPTRDWAAQRSGPTVNAYLFEIREDLSRRHVAFREEKGERGETVGRSEPTRYFKLHYLVTAWTQRAEDEHLLLSSLLWCLASHRTMPRGHLGDALSQHPSSVVMTVAMPPAEDRLVSDVWTAIGGQLRPTLDLVVVAPLATAVRYQTGPPVREGLSLRSATGHEGPTEEGPVRPGPRPPGRHARLATGTTEEVELVTAGDSKEPGRSLSIRRGPRP